MTAGISFQLVKISSENFAALPTNDDKLRRVARPTINKLRLAYVTRSLCPVCDPCAAFCDSGFGTGLPGRQQTLRQSNASVNN